jgi:CRISPR-associated endonuclease Csn1
MKVDEIVDPTIREIVRARLAAFGGKAKDAFAKPLYSDAAQTMEIKSVRCYTGLQDRAVAAVRFNDLGEAIGYAKTGNNHHIAIYQDANGQYQELVVSFWQAVERKRYGLPIVIEDSKAVWDRMMDMDLPQAFLETLPKDDWQFVVSLQANEMFILGLEDGDFEMAMENKDYQLLNKHLYRVQKIGSKDYSFRHHIETSVDDKYDGVTNIALSLSMKKLLRLRSFGSWFAQYPHKVRVNLLGEIAEV